MCSISRAKSILRWCNGAYKEGLERRVSKEMQRVQEDEDSGEMSRKRKACRQVEELQNFLQVFNEDVRSAMEELSDRDLMDEDTKRLRKDAGNVSIIVTGPMIRLANDLKNALQALKEFEEASAEFKQRLFAD